MLWAWCPGLSGAPLLKRLMIRTVCSRKQLCIPYRQFQTDWPVYLEHVHKLRDAERSGVKPKPRASAALLYRALMGRLAWLKYYHSQTSLYCLNSRTTHNQTSLVCYTWHIAQITFMKYSINITHVAVKNLCIIIETQHHWKCEIREQMGNKAFLHFIFLPSILRHDHSQAGHWWPGGSKLDVMQDLIQVFRLDQGVNIGLVHFGNFFHYQTY